ncbi:hypothetical protein VIGAN_07126200, partial [Vigna angularis var. angularis]
NIFYTSLVPNLIMLVSSTGHSNRHHFENVECSLHNELEWSNELGVMLKEFGTHLTRVPRIVNFWHRLSTVGCFWNLNST